MRAAARGEESVGKKHRTKGYGSTLKWLQDLNARRNAETLETLIREDRPYALYLRSYAVEIRPDVRAVEAPLVSELRRYLPTFCLLNGQYPYDDRAPRLNNEVFVSAADWFPEFTRYAAGATLVVAHVEVATQNLAAELRWLLDSGQAQTKTFLLVTEKAIEGLDPGRAEVFHAARWVQGLPPAGARGRAAFCPALPAELREYLSRHST
jgi:hypothetical protein